MVMGSVISITNLKNIDSSYNNLRNIFESDINAMHIAEILEYCKMDDDSKIILERMESSNYHVYGVSNEEGVICGYIEKSELKEGQCKEYFKNFESSELIADSTPLIEILRLLKVKPQLFVLCGSKIRGIITLADLQKVTVRILLFGLISLLEMRMTEIINDYYPNNTWKHHIKDERLDLACEIFDDKEKCRENIELIDCLQLSDKSKILINTPELLKKLQYSRNHLKSILGNTVNLRNKLVHSRNLGDYKDHYIPSLKIIELSENLSNLLEKMSKIQ